MQANPTGQIQDSTGCLPLWDFVVVVVDRHQKTLHIPYDNSGLLILQQFM
jgi:hypothetical protein